MRVNVCPGHSLGFNRRHVACHALAPGASLLVVRMLFERGRVRPIGRARAVAIKANLVRRLYELRVVLGPVDIVACEAGESAPVHHALHKIVSLHAVLVRGAIGKMSEACLPQRMVLELPKIL